MAKGTKAFYDTLKDDGVESGEALPGTESFFGRNARIANEGYRPDGSYLYGRTLRRKDDYLFASTLSRIDKGKGRFKTAEKINTGSLEELGRFLGLCADEGIHVVAFLPPYASPVHDRLLKDKGNYPHVFSLHSELSPLFEKLGFKLFDFSDLRSVGSNDFETYDGFHASEVAYLKLLAIMAAGDETLRGELNAPLVGSLLSSPHSARQLVEEVEEAFPQSPSR